MAKEKKEKKSKIPTLCNIKRFVAAVGGAFVLLGASIGLFGCNKHQSQPEVTTPPYKTEQEVTKQLPDFEDSLKFYEELGADTSYLSYQYTNGSTKNQFYDTRLAPPEDPIAFNICIDDLSEKAKQVYVNTAEELNDIFEIINPKYRFEVNFNPDSKARNNKYNINVYSMSEAEKDRTDAWGTWYGTIYIKTVDGQTTENSQIHIRDVALEMQGVFTHEVLHHLGLGDAYKVTKTDSIMQAGDNKYIRRNDLILLAGKYGDYSTPEKKAELIEFIDNYKTIINTSKVQRYIKLIANYMDVDESEVKPLQDGSIIIKDNMKIDSYTMIRDISVVVLDNGELYTGSGFHEIKTFDYKYAYKETSRKDFVKDSSFMAPFGSLDSHNLFVDVNGVPYEVIIYSTNSFDVIELGQYATQKELELFLEMEENPSPENLFKDASVVKTYNLKSVDGFAVEKNGEQIYDYDLSKNYKVFPSKAGVVLRDSLRNNSWVLFMPISEDGTMLCYGYTFKGEFFEDTYQMVPKKGKSISDIIEIQKEVEQ